MIPEDVRNLAKVYEETELVLLTIIKDKQWHQLEQARLRLSKELTARRQKLSGSWVAVKSESKEVIYNVYSRLLARDVADDLVKRGVCEGRNGEGSYEIRLKPKGGSKK